MGNALPKAEIEQRLAQVEGWSSVRMGVAEGIEKTFSTGNFLKGLGFVTRVAVLAEKANHHPDVVLTYPKVTIALTTHDAGGVTEKDFKLAGEIDGIGV